MSSLESSKDALDFHQFCFSRRVKGICVSFILMSALGLLAYAFLLGFFLGFFFFFWPGFVKFHFM